MASLKSALSDVVSVRRADEALKPLIAPQAQYFLRQNLSLQFQAARLAVLRNEKEIFESSLDDAAAWLQEYYDTGNPAVKSAQQTITDIRGSVFSIAKPDISESLRLLRQFNAFSEVADESEQEDVTPDSEPAEPIGTDAEQEPQQ
jgi:uroporphyrin-3 C-methyltransferase